MNLPFPPSANGSHYAVSRGLPLATKVLSAIRQSAFCADCPVAGTRVRFSSATAIHPAHQQQKRSLHPRPANGGRRPNLF